MKSVEVTINKQVVIVPVNNTILDAAQKLNIPIPTLCHLNGHESFTSCMICVVHDINSGRLVPACSQPVTEGMRIVTDDEKVKEARKDTLEFLLSEHVGDCEAPCRRACPANMNIPSMIRLIKERRFTDAIRMIKKDIALPAVLGRICSAPCEKVCSRKQVDDPVSICYLKRFAADVDLSSESPYLPEIANKSGKQAAIVGAGPAGLAAAFYLLQAGHDCIIYDQNQKPGGMLRYGVPVERLPESALDAEIRQIFALGATYRPGQTLGKDIRLDELRNKYDAVVLTIGKIDPDLFENSGLELSKRGIEINKKTFATTLPGVFAGGNAVAESRMAVRAAAHGKGIAYSVNRFLNGLPVTGLPRRFDSRMGKISAAETEEFLKEAGRHKQVVPRGGVLNGYSEPEAVKESTRCMRCDCRKPEVCKLRRYAEAYGAKQGRFKLRERQKFQRFVQHDRVIYEPGKCIKCGLCVQITKKAGEKFGLTFVYRGFAARVNIPFGEPLSRALEKTAEECIDACPTGALSRRDQLKDKKHD
jgi:ferredoxin